MAGCGLCYILYYDIINTLYYEITAGERLPGRRGERAAGGGGGAGRLRPQHRDGGAAAGALWMIYNIV